MRLCGVHVRKSDNKRVFFIKTHTMLDFSAQLMRLAISQNAVPCAAKVTLFHLELKWLSKLFCHFQYCVTFCGLVDRMFVCEIS